MRSLFHLAFHVHDLSEARHFYGEILGCKEGRYTNNWVDFDFFGHQLSLHTGEPFKTTQTGHVGNHIVSMPHFGVLLELNEWNALVEKLRAHNIEFELAPTVRFKGEPGEQWTMFFTDPSGNPIEVKGLNNLDEAFAK